MSDTHTDLKDTILNPEISTPERSIAKLLTQVEPNRFIRERTFTKTYRDLQGHPDTISRIDEMDSLFKISLENSGSQFHQKEIDQRSEEIKSDIEVTMLTPEAKMLVEATLEAFDEFSQIVAEYKGYDDTKNKPTINIDGIDLKKYEGYWDYAEQRYGPVRAWDGNNGIPRNTEVSRNVRLNIKEKVERLSDKLSNGDPTKDDIKDYIKNVHLLEFASLAKWTENGSPITNELPY